MKFANHYLLASIFLVFFIGPVAFDYGLLSIVNLEILFLLILIFSIFLHQHDTKLFKVTVVSLIIILINILFFDNNQSVSQYFLKILIVSITIVELFKEIFKTKKIDSYIISSAISIYVLVGIFWYLLFMFLLMIDPDSFHIRNFNPEMVTIDMIYFSFTTLTTLGYGDITPLSYTAKMWSITEAMMGVMFLAIMISRVVSLFGSKKKN
ncbi:potassium channel family protein [Methylophilaceae bacterium]|nr:potassium channel family protein [Methylophilaceae bacterium]